MAQPGPAAAPPSPQDLLGAMNVIARQDAADAAAREAARIAQMEQDEQNRLARRQFNAQRRQQESVKRLREELNAGRLVIWYV